MTDYEIFETEPQISLLGRSRIQDMAEDDLERAAEGVNIEDMVRVTPDMIRGSYMLAAAYMTQEGGKHLAGIARIKEQKIIPYANKLILASELGSFWVDPEFRDQGLGFKLISALTDVVSEAGFIPFGVCNDAGRPRFEQAGFEPVANILSSDGTKIRTVEMFKGHEEPEMQARWAAGLEQIALDALREFPRFHKMTPYREPVLQA